VACDVAGPGSKRQAIRAMDAMENRIRAMGDHFSLHTIPPRFFRK
jgi:hypothetical protein